MGVLFKFKVSILQNQWSHYFDPGEARLKKEAESRYSGIAVPNYVPR